MNQPKLTTTEKVLIEAIYELFYTYEDRDEKPIITLYGISKVFYGRFPSGDVTRQVKRNLIKMSEKELKADGMDKVVFVTFKKDKTISRGEIVDITLNPLLVEQLKPFFKNRRKGAIKRLREAIYLVKGNREFAYSIYELRHYINTLIIAGYTDHTVNVDELCYKLEPTNMRLSQKGRAKKIVDKAIRVCKELGIIRTAQIIENDGEPKYYFTLGDKTV